MGLFGRGTKVPEKGVEKEKRQKHRFFIFFDVVFRKFMKFMQLNLMFLVFSLPYLLLLYWLSPINVTSLSGVSMSGIGEFVQSLPYEDAVAFELVLRLLFALGVVILWGAGPASAGCAYVMRNFSREEHAWVFSDFWDNVKSNFKQSITVLLIDIVILYLSLVAFNFYSHQYALSPNSMFLVAQGLLAFLLILYTFMHYYIYQIMVTYKVKLSVLYKNALLFAVAKFPQNIFFTVLSGGILLGLFVLLNVFAALAFVIVFTALCKFIIEFYTAEVIRKNTIQK